MPFPPAAVPPDILDYPTSTDMVVTEGSNVTLTCAATGKIAASSEHEFTIKLPKIILIHIRAGSPKPTIIWKRETNEAIYKFSENNQGELWNYSDRSFDTKYTCDRKNQWEQASRYIHFPLNLTRDSVLVFTLAAGTERRQCTVFPFPKMGKVNWFTFPVRLTGETSPNVSVAIFYENTKQIKMIIRFGGNLLSIFRTFFPLHCDENRRKMTLFRWVICVWIQ